MKVVVLNNLSDKEFHEVIGGHEVITLSKNYLKKYYNADLFTDCKRVTTALRRFFKALEKDYVSFNNYKKEIEESVKKGIYTKSLFEKFDFGYTIGMTHEGYYISVTVPMEQEPEPEEPEVTEPEEPEEQEEENTSMKDIKIRTSWSRILKDDENGWSDSDKSNIILDIDIKGVTWSLGCDIMDALEDKINRDGFYSCTREGCPDFDEERSTFLDCLFFERDYGSIREQKRHIIKYVNSIKKEVIKEVLEPEAK